MGCGSLATWGSVCTSCDVVLVTAYLSSAAEIVARSHATLPRLGVWDLPDSSFSLPLACVSGIRHFAGRRLDRRSRQCPGSKQAPTPPVPTDLPANIDNLPCLYPYVIALIFWIGGNTIAHVRLASVVLGLLAVVAVYLLGRRAGGPALGLCAAALCAVAQWAIDFSRFGVAQVAAPGTVGLAFALFGVAMARPTVFWFAITGFWASRCCRIMEPSLLRVPSLGSFYCSGCSSTHPIAGRRGPLCCCSPSGLSWGRHRCSWRRGSMPTMRLGGSRPPLLWVSTLTGHIASPAWWPAHAHLMMFTVFGDRNGRHNFPGAPMLDPVTGACFLLGLGMCIRGIRHWFSQLVLLWLAASMLSGILSVDFEAPQAARSVGAIPPIMLMAALPLATLARAVRRAANGIPALLPRRGFGRRIAQERDITTLRRSLLSTGLAALVVAVPLGIATTRNLNQYFGQQASDPSSWADMGGDVAIMGRAIPPLLSRDTVFGSTRSSPGCPAWCMPPRGTHRRHTIPVCLWGCRSLPAASR